MSTSQKILIVAAIIAAVLASVWLLVATKSAQATTNRTSYHRNDNLEISIKNNLGRALCFSSCYPYLVEKQTSGGQWEPYPYAECKKENIGTSCIPENGQKKFQFKLDYETNGMHRLRIPVCVGCAAEDQFRANAELFSNEFEII